MADLPINIDTTYADSGTDASVQLHQSHHDTIHAQVNALAQPMPTVGSASALPGVVVNSTLNQATGASTLYYQPFVVTRTITVSQAQARIQTAGTAGGTSRLAIYHAGTDWQPGALVSDLGTIATDSTGQKSITSLSVTLTPGLYLMRLHSDASATQPTYSTLRGGPITGSLVAMTSAQMVYQLTVGLAYAAAETPGTAWTSVSTSTSPFVYYIFLVWSVV